ncbi:MAG: hypothetical protein DI556_12740 [Rhodovulum sulfidophilum]|uniref:Uncharacterized protein n=1 Tax=Rhodovulum sulfidophilum TaxID=35806 RepID=A0A2W5N8Y2_RHOSU|nr:MAG: hypothetical protein DI556_12740 [Rhodovulum sulfidophilum]
MIELVFLACLRTAPLDCQEKVVKFMPAANAALCMIQAQPELASWVSSHPERRIAKWGCRDMREDVAERNDPAAQPPL